ncbi:helix-turn-helix domain-containing protein [Streptomyces sp. NPDC002328]|uniref:helix-turn-helix domain-containing protein n=1 Tax=Streptomyces sp. NPDC002328 TaxID=3364642 RepID=UPI0036A4E164
MPRDQPDWIIERRRDLGERIADLRAAAHHTQETFCATTGISRSTLQRIEAGEADPRYGDLLRIAAALDKSISTLVDPPR